MGGGGGGGGGGGINTDPPPGDYPTCPTCPSGQYCMPDGAKPPSYSCVVIDTGGGGEDKYKALTDKIKEAQKLRMIIQGLLLAAALMLLIASIWYMTGCCYCIGLPFGGVGAALGIIAAYLCTQLHSMGNDINNMEGGSPAGDQYKKAGIVYGVLAVTITIVSLIPAAAGVAPVVAVVIAGVVVFVATLADMIWGIIK